MPDVRYLAELYKRTMSALYQEVRPVVAGTLGDGTTTKRVEVADSRVHVYFRPKLNDAELWEVRHLVSDVPRWHGWPALCAYNKEIGEWEVVSTDVDALPGYFETFDFRYVTEHASQHIINEEDVGNDPVWIYRRAIVNLRPRPAPDDTLRLYVQEGALPFPVHDTWAGGYGPELGRYVPSTGEVWITHYIVDTATGAELRASVGSSHPQALRYDVDPPDVPPGAVPIGYVALASDATELTEAVIWDARKLWCPISYLEDLLDQLAHIRQYYDHMWRLHLEGEL